MNTTKLGLSFSGDIGSIIYYPYSFAVVEAVSNVSSPEKRFSRCCTKALSGWEPAYVFDKVAYKFDAGTST